MKEHVAEIVAAYVGNNSVSPEQLPALISAVNEALSSLGKASASAAGAALTPAVPIRRSVRADRITCLECGYQGQMLKRHLDSVHLLTPEQYRARWDLAADYPMVARNYARRRSELAKATGLGTRAGRAKR